MHSVGEEDTWQPGAGDGTVQFGLEMSQTNTEEAVIKEGDK